jgi:hypothetical protein
MSKNQLMTKTIVKIYHVSSKSLRLTNEDNTIDFVKGSDVHRIYICYRTCNLSTIDDFSCNIFS